MAAMMHARNNTVLFLWDKMFILMQNIFIVPGMQHGRHAKPLLHSFAESTATVKKCSLRRIVYLSQMDETPSFIQGAYWLNSLCMYIQFKGVLCNDKACIQGRKSLPGAADSLACKQVQGPGKMNVHKIQFPLLVR